MKKVIYTFIFGAYDDLKQPKVITKGWDYYCFTDQEIENPGIWKLIRLGKIMKPSVMARYVNILGHMYLDSMGNPDILVSIGGQVQINCDLNKFLNTYFPNNVCAAFVKHPYRNCIYDEGEACIRLKKDDPDIIRNQMEEYKKCGFPKGQGMIETGVMIRRIQDKNLQQHCIDWWYEIENKSFRDQLSFNYVLWKYKHIKNYCLMPSSVLRGKEYFEVCKHNHQKKK